MPFILLSAAIVLLDQAVKALITHRLVMVGASVPFLPGLLRLTLVHNFGASWGMLSGRTTFLLILTAIVCLALIVALLLEKPIDGSLGRLSLSFILGGAVGNALDRFTQGYVVDMFETEFMSFPVFNTADCFITVGAVLLCIYIILEEKKEKRKRQEASRLRWERSRTAAWQEAQRREELKREFDDHDDGAPG